MTDLFALYGAPLPGLAEIPAGAVQFSPLTPGANRLEDLAPGALAGMVMLAPPGVVERRYVLALSLKALAPGARLTVMALKDKGGSRLKKELEAFGCTVGETSKKHHRICVVHGASDPAALDAAIADGAPQRVEDLGLWSQPGVFSWNRIDPGTALLAEQLPVLSGRGADLGCGVGFLSHAVLASPKVTALTLVDLDRRAFDAATRNVGDPRVKLVWGDVRTVEGLTDLDFVVMNPPFHDGGSEDRKLGQGFIRAAHAALSKGGVCWLVANRHLPYEAVLGELFTPRDAKERDGRLQGL